MASYAVLHSYHHSDYELAKQHIAQQMGDVDLELFGKQVLVAVYVRPLIDAANKVIISDKMQTEDMLQGKIVLVVKTGPWAFGDDDNFYGEKGPPKPGDWLFVRAAAGEPISLCGPGAAPVKYEDRHGDAQALYVPWEQGWPCRVMDDDNFVGRVMNPHTII